MRRITLILFPILTIMIMLAVPVLLYQADVPICLSSVAAQDTPCLAQEATISALQLENLQLQLTNEALMNGDTPQAVATVLVIVTATPNAVSDVSTLPPSITPGGAVMAAPAPQYDEVNIRANPDLEAELVGTMAQGEQYEVIGRFYRWLQIDYPDAETGTAWVFESVITATGSLGSVPEVVPENYRTIRVMEIAGTGNLASEAVRLQNGGDTLEITGWILNNQTTGESYTFPQILFFSGSQIVLNTRSGTDMDNLLYWGLDMPVWSAGDILTLLDTDGNTIIELTIEE